MEILALDGFPSLEKSSVSRLSDGTTFSPQKLEVFYGITNPRSEKTETNYAWNRQSYLYADLKLCVYIYISVYMVINVGNSEGIVSKKM